MIDVAEKSKQTEKLRHEEKSRHEYKSKHWTLKCAHTDKKLERKIQINSASDKKFQALHSRKQGKQ